jgi:hypothetical protein
MVEPPLLDDEPVSSGPGCFLWGCIGLFILALSAAIIALAGFAGFSAGTRIAQANALATQNAAISQQLSLIPGDIASGNQFLLSARIQFLATLTPAVSGLGDIMQTATAVYLTSVPTATPTPMPTVLAQPTVISTPTSAPLAVTPGVALDLPALLEDARLSVSLADWGSAVETLDVILAADSTFQSTVVRSLMSEALNAQALQLFRFGTTGDLAEALRLTDRAREFGDVGELAYESYIAGLYLEAFNTLGIDFPTTIRSLQQVYNEVPNYRDVRQLLVQQYTGYGDAWVAQFEFCPAAAQYQNALALVQDAAVSAKLTNAQTLCAQATPLGGATPLPGTLIAPVGQPGG